MVPPDPQLFTSLNIIQPVIDKQTLPRRQIKAAQRKLVNLRIGLGQFLLSGNDNIGEIIENRLALTKMRPEFRGKIGYGEKADIRVMQALDQRGDAVNLTGVGFVKAGVKGADKLRMIGKAAYQFTAGIAKSASGIMLEMPIGRDDIFQKPFQFLRVIDQLFIKKAYVPPGNHVPDVKNYGVNPGGRGTCHEAGLALTGFEPAIRFVDHIGAATTTDHAAVTMTVFERL